MIKIYFWEDLIIVTCCLVVSNHPLVLAFSVNHPEEKAKQKLNNIEYISFICVVDRVVIARGVV